MKKEYERPIIEILSLKVNEYLMDDDAKLSGEIVEQPDF